jgi:hypothetical protein
MGIYQDIQTDMREAMNGDLSDAVATLVITEEVSSGVYDPLIGGGMTYTPVIYTMDCIVLGDHEENKDGEDTSTDFVELLILDSDKTIPEFKPGMKATVRNTDYETGKVEIDPVGATHTLKCRKI